MAARTLESIHPELLCPILYIRLGDILDELEDGLGDRCPRCRSFIHMEFSTEKEEKQGTYSQSNYSETYASNTIYIPVNQVVYEKYRIVKTINRECGLCFHIQEWKVYGDWQKRSIEIKSSWVKGSASNYTMTYTTDNTNTSDGTYYGTYHRMMKNGSQ